MLAPPLSDPTIPLHYMLTDSTDVQEAILRVDSIQRAINLTCVFIRGSNARGCFLTIQAAFGNYTIPIPKQEGLTTHFYFIGESLGLLSYAVYDWEEDKTVGQVAVPSRLLEVPLQIPTATSCKSGV